MAEILTVTARPDTCKHHSHATNKNDDRQDTRGNSHPVYRFEKTHDDAK